MPLARNKKGEEIRYLVEIIIVLLVMGAIIGIIYGISGKANEKTSETLCRTFNALRYGTKVETKPADFNIAPRACSTINKENPLPSKDFKGHPLGAEEGAQAEIRDLMTICWDMWLNGHQKNMFDKKWYNLENGCFVCYTFTLDKSLKHISYEDFSASLSQPFYAVDDTDKCAPFGQGGKCKPSCDTGTDYFSKEVTGLRSCQPGFKCCIASDSRDTCKNKGGRCMSAPDGEYNMLYSNPQWKCSNSGLNCYMKQKNIASYLDYIQGSGGVIGGAGKVLFAQDGGFSPGNLYAITFVSPGKEFDMGTGKGLFLAAAGTAATIYMTVQTAGLAPIALMVAKGAIVAGAAYTSFEAFTTANSGSVQDINYLLISKYDSVSKNCAIEAGAGQT